MPITRTAYNDHLIIAFKGRLDVRFIQAQREVLEQLPSQINSTVLFDLSGIDFIDSSGIGFLVYIFKRIKPQNYAMAIIGLTGQPRDTVEMLRINRMIDCADTLEDFEKQASEKEYGTKRSMLRRLVSSRRQNKNATINRAAKKHRLAGRR